MFFNISILNSANFRRYTGKNPPPTPVTAQDYVDNGLPYFAMYDEPTTGVHGLFEHLKSVNTLDKMDIDDEEKRAAVDEVTDVAEAPIILIDKTGRQVSFTSAENLKYQLQRFRLAEEMKKIPVWRRNASGLW